MVTTQAELAAPSMLKSVKYLKEVSLMIEELRAVRKTYEVLYH